MDKSKIVNLKSKITIVAFLCNWCSYGAQDRAGRARMPIPSNLKVIRVMCSGRVDPQLVVDALRSGVEGVLICGCHLGDCHYKEGNYRALRQYHLLRKLLSELGIRKERLRLEWVGPTEGEKLARIATQMSEELKES